MTMKRTTACNFSTLLRCIDPSPDLLGRLRSVQFVEDQISAISKQPTDNHKNNALLNALLEVPDDIEESVMNGFISALRFTGQEHVANIFRNESNKVPMSDDHYRTLTAKTTQLCKWIDPEHGLLDEMVSTEVISPTDDQYVRSMSGSYEMSRKLVEVLMRKSDDAFDGFIMALNQTEQSHVSYLLTGKSESGKVPMSDEHHRTLATKIGQLCQFIDPENGLLDEMVSTEVISLTHADYIRSVSGYNEMARKLIEVLTRKSDDAFDGFIRALDQTGQSHVTFMLTGQGDSRPLSEEWRDKLIEKRLDVVNSIYTPCLMSALISKRVFSPYDQQRVEARQTALGKAETVVDLISRKSQASFDGFMQVLQERHEHVVKVLTGHKVAGKLQTQISANKDVEEKKDMETKLREQVQHEFENDDTEVKRHLTPNGISVSEVLASSIIVKFHCKDHAAVVALQKLYSSKTLDQLFSESFVPMFADKGLESLSFDISDEEFQRCFQLKLMRDEHRQRLWSAEDWLVDKMVVSDELLDKLSLCDQRRQAIETAPTQEEQVKTLLDIVSRQPDCAFTQLVNALNDTNQHKAANIISGDSSSVTDREATELHQTKTEDAWEYVERNLENLLQSMTSYFHNQDIPLQRPTILLIYSALRDVVTSLRNLREQYCVRLPTSRPSTDEELERFQHRVEMLLHPRAGEMSFLTLHTS